MSLAEVRERYLLKPTAASAIAKYPNGVFRTLNHEPTPAKNSVAIRPLHIRQEASSDLTSIRREPKQLDPSSRTIGQSTAISENDDVANADQRSDSRLERNVCYFLLPKDVTRHVHFHDA